MARALTSIDRQQGKAAYRIVLCLLMAWLLPGCGDGTDHPTTVKVHGAVTCDGQPLTKGSIAFQATSDTTLRPATGELNEDGTYELSSFQRGDGAMPGEYKVVIVSLKSGPTLENPNQPEVSAIPEKYTRAETTDLTASIPTGGGGEIKLDFDLTN